MLMRVKPGLSGPWCRRRYRKGIRGKVEVRRPQERDIGWAEVNVSEELEKPLTWFWFPVYLSLHRQTPATPTTNTSQ